MMDHREHIGYKLRLLHNGIDRQMEKRVEKDGEHLTGMQRFLIKFLRKHEGEDIYQKDIETGFSISGATVSNILQLMERKGLIVRVQAEHDARLKKILLTGRAKRLAEAAERDVARMEAVLTEGMTDEEVRQLKQYLDRMIKNIGADSGAFLPGCCCGREEGSGGSKNDGLS